MFFAAPFRSTAPAVLPAALALVASACSLSCLQAAPAPSPKSVLEQALQELVRVAETSRGVSPTQLAQRTRPTLEKLFNFETLTKRAVGLGWKELSSDQQKRAVELFSEILILSYASRFDWDKQLAIEFSAPVELGAGRTEVNALTRYAGNQVNVLYRLETSAGRWTVYDVVIEGVSLTANYRAQFDSIRQRKGGEGLIQLMQETLKQASAKKSS